MISDFLSLQWLASMQEGCKFNFSNPFKVLQLPPIEDLAFSIPRTSGWMDGWMLVGWLDDGWRMVGLGKERKKNMGNNDRGKIAMKKRKKKAKKNH